MKTTFTLSLLLWCCIIQAQNWCPAGAAWHYSVNRGQTAGYQYWHYDRDTIVAGINCKIVSGAQYLTTTGVADTAIALLGPVYTYSANDTVYLFDTAFYPAYYFNAHAGDTIYTRNMDSLNLAVVDSSNTLVFNGDTLRYYLFHLLGSCADSSSNSFKVIERIGGAGTSFVPVWNCGDTAPYHYALCNYVDSAFAVYPDSSTNCTYLNTPVVFTYHHLLEDVNIWHYTTYIMGERPILNTDTMAKSLSHCGENTLRGFVYTVDDTLIGAHTYKPVAAKNTQYWIQGDSCLLGYIREDTTKGKVYFLDRDSAHEFLMYDFSMVIGDSMHIQFSNNQPYGYFQSGNYTLDRVDTIQISAGTRKEFYLNCHSCSNSHPLRWIESVGNLLDNIYPNTLNGNGYISFLHCGAYQDSFQQFVVCYEHAQKVYTDTCAYNESLWVPGFATDSCDFNIFLGGAVQKLTSLSSFTTYPNPTNNNVTVQLNVAESANFDVYVKDIEGKTIAGHLSLGRLNSGLHNAEMDVSNLSPGFYLVECRTTDGSLYSKLIIQK